MSKYVSTTIQTAHYKITTKELFDQCEIAAEQCKFWVKGYNYDYALLICREKKRWFLPMGKGAKIKIQMLQGGNVFI